MDFIVDYIQTVTLTTCNQLCFRKGGKRFTAYTIVTNETPVNYRKLNENPEEQFVYNNELGATHLYSEIADNNHCEQVRGIMKGIIR